MDKPHTCNPSIVPCLTAINSEKQLKPMATLWIAGCFAILLGLILLKTGKGETKVDIQYYGLGVFTQAWLILILTGFLLIALDVYISIQ